MKTCMTHGRLPTTSKKRPGVHGKYPESAREVHGSARERAGVHVRCTGSARECTGSGFRSARECTGKCTGVHGSARDRDIGSARHMNLANPGVHGIGVMGARECTGECTGVHGSARDRVWECTRASLGVHTCFW